MKTLILPILFVSLLAACGGNDPPPPPPSGVDCSEALGSCDDPCKLPVASAAALDTDAEGNVVGLGGAGFHLAKSKADCECKPIPECIACGGDACISTTHECMKDACVARCAGDETRNADDVCVPKISEGGCDASQQTWNKPDGAKVCVAKCPAGESLDQATGKCTPGTDPNATCRALAEQCVTAGKCFKVGSSGEVQKEASSDGEFVDAQGKCQVECTSCQQPPECDPPCDSPPTALCRDNTAINFPVMGKCQAEGTCAYPEIPQNCGEAQECVVETDGDGVKNAKCQDVGCASDNECLELYASKHVIAECEEKACVPTGCVDGYQDDDNDLENGCVRITGCQSDSECATQFQTLHVTGACQAGECVAKDCAPGFDDKDGDLSNGCCEPSQCGGSCGGCEFPETCGAGGQCVCKPDCAGKACGPDGCGGTCGTCTDNPATANVEKCDEAKGQCVCPTISCTGRECGSDGCSGFCEPFKGQCPPANPTCSTTGICSNLRFKMTGRFVAGAATVASANNRFKLTGRTVPSAASVASSNGRFKLGGHVTGGAK